MKKLFIESLKTAALHSAVTIFRFFGFLKRIGSLCAKPIQKVLFAFYRAILHPIILFVYSWYVRGSLSLQKRGVAMRHPLFSLVSRRHLHHSILVGIFLLAAAHTAYLKNANAQEFFIPHNTLSRLYFIDDEFSLVVEGKNQSTDSGYVDQIGDRPQVTPDGNDNQGASVTPDPGTIAAIPDALVKPVVPTLQNEPYKATAIQTYVVKGGDTIGGIARSFGIKVATLLFSNNLTDQSFIHEGEKLVILPVDGIQYRVRRGDTLAQIAHDYQSTVEKIMTSNQRANANDIAVGELLIIPGGVALRPVQQPRQNIIARIRNAIAPPPSTQSGAKGTFIWPTSASRITQYFSWHHTGVDIAGPTTNRIFAAGDGRVVFAGWANGYGNSIVIDHGNGLKTRYGHSRLLYVGVGDYVTQGQTIAMIGSTGHSTGPHLHFEVMKNNVRVNPFGYIR